MHFVWAMRRGTACTRCLAWLIGLLHFAAAATAGADSLTITFDITSGDLAGFPIDSGVFAVNVPATSLSSPAPGPAVASILASGPDVSISGFVSGTVTAAGSFTSDEEASYSGSVLGVPGFGSCWAAQIAVAAAGGRVAASPHGREMGVGRKIKLMDAVSLCTWN